MMYVQYINFIIGNRNYFNNIYEKKTEIREFDSLHVYDRVLYVRFRMFILIIIHVW